MNRREFIRGTVTAAAVVALPVLPAMAALPDPPLWAFKQMAPMVKIPLATIDAPTNVILQESLAGTAHLLKIIERNMFYGDTKRTDDGYETKIHAYATLVHA